MCTAEVEECLNFSELRADTTIQKGTYHSCPYFADKKTETCKISQPTGVVSRSVMSHSFDPMDCSPPGSSVHADSPGKSPGVGCHALLQGIFPAQGSNPSLPHCRWILYHPSHQGSPTKGRARIQVLILTPDLSHFDPRTKDCVCPGRAEVRLQPEEA